MKATIDSISYVGTINTKYGERHKWSCTYDGKAASFLTKTAEDCPFKEGEENEFTESENEYKGTTYYNIRPIKSGSSNFSRKLKQEQARYSGFAMSYAKDLVVAGKVEPENMFTIAEEMYDWMVTKDKDLQHGK